VIGSFFASDNTCAICRGRFPDSCVHRAFVGAGGARPSTCAFRWPTAPWSPPRPPRRTMIPSLLAASDVLGTGWFGAVAADVQPGKTVVVVGDGAVGLLAVLAAKQLAPSGSSR